MRGQQPVCALYGRSSAKVAFMVANDAGTAICSDCVEVAAAKIAEAKAR